MTRTRAKPRSGRDADPCAVCLSAPPAARGVNCLPCRDRLVTDNVRLAQSIANSERRRRGLVRARLAREDAAGAAMLGLVQAAGSWRPGRGEFLFYAGRAIRNEILRQSLRGGVISLPNYLLSKERATGWDAKCRRANDANLRRAATAHEITEDAFRQPGGGPAELPPWSGADELARLAGLTAAERAAVRAIYGDGLTVREAAGRLGVSRSRAMQWKASAEGKLRGRLRWSDRDQWPVRNSD